MTDYKYSIEIMKKEIESKYICPEIKYTFNACIEALERQIPKQIIGIEANLQNIYCPSCNEWMIFERVGSVQFCPMCGQAIDWKVRMINE